MTNTERELKVEGIFYLKMQNGETEDEVKCRFFKLIEGLDIDWLDCSIKYEVNEVQLKKIDLI